MRQIGLHRCERLNRFTCGLDTADLVIDAVSVTLRQGPVLGQLQLFDFRLNFTKRLSDVVMSATSDFTALVLCPFPELVAFEINFRVFKIAVR